MRIARSLRARLILLFITVTGIAVLALAVAMSALIEHAVWAPLDAELKEEGETLCSLLAAGAIDDVKDAVVALVGERSPGPGKFVRVVAGDGALVAEAGPVPPAIRRRPAPAVPRARTVELPARKYPQRVVWYPEGDCRALVGINAAGYVRTVTRGQLAVALGAAGLLITLAALAWIITTRATAELDRLSAEIETIEATSLGRRLVPRHTLEVDRLSAVLNRLLARLDAAMGHLRRFTADAAHELRTPVAGLRARLEVAIGGPHAADAYRNGLLDALEQAERLGRLAEDLLTLSAVEAGVTPGGVEPVRLDALAREVADFVEPVAQAQGRRFECAAADPVTVLGAPQLLKRVVLNLVDNAFRHTPPASPVRLEVRADDGVATVEIRDAGPGIAPEDRDLVFQRFRRGQNAGPGSGLGLALCEEIVARHRGHMVLDSDPVRGTTVRATLPTPAA
jgi:signal transduction histidine kinase